MAKKRVLLVDYEPKLLERLQSLLQDDRFELATAKDGFAAIEEFDRFHPDVVFLRTMLPKKHGFQVCQEMVERSGSRRVPIIMHCSIYKSRKYRSDAMKIYGAAEYLEDPIQEGALKDILDRFVFGSPPAAVPAPPAAAANGRKAELPEVVLPPAAPATKPKTATNASIDKALEDTLSGMQIVSSKKPKAASVEATVPFEDLLGMKPSQPPRKEPAPSSAASADAPGVTSEDLFGDVIQDVIRTETKAPQAPSPEPPKVEAPKPRTAQSRARAQA